MEPGCYRFHIDSGKKGGPLIGPNPTDRGRAGTKHHLVTDKQGLPLAEFVTEANTHDSREALALVDDIAPVQGARGRPRQRPKKLHADKGYDYRRVREGLWKRHIQPRIARRGVDSSKRLGRYRCIQRRAIFSRISCSSVRTTSDRGMLEESTRRASSAGLSGATARAMSSWSRLT